MKSASAFLALTLTGGAVASFVPAIAHSVSLNSTGHHSSPVSHSNVTERGENCASELLFLKAADGHVVPKDWCPGFLGAPSSTVTLTNTVQATSTFVNWTHAYNSTATETRLTAVTDISWVWQHTVTVTSTSTNKVCPPQLRRRTMYIPDPEPAPTVTTTREVSTLSRVRRTPSPTSAPTATPHRAVATTPSPIPTWLSGWSPEAVTDACKCLSLTPMPAYSFTEVTETISTVTTTSTEYVSILTFNSTTHPVHATMWTTWTSVPEITLTYISC